MDSQSHQPQSHINMTLFGHEMHISQETHNTNNAEVSQNVISSVVVVVVFLIVIVVHRRHSSLWSLSF